MSKSNKLQDLKRICEEDLFNFAAYLNPQYMYGNVHKNLARFLMGVSKDQLILLPRGHLKSHWVAMWCCWWITKYPETTIGYCSATEQLAIAQLDFMKKVFESDKYRTLWPEMIHADVGKRERWAATSIKVDHPRRIDQKIRDATIHAFGITGNTTGLHFDALVFDDVVVLDNVETEESRSKVAGSHAQLSASVLNVGGITKTVGTLYHPRDLYNTMMNTFVEEYDEKGDSLSQSAIYEIFRDQVETNGIFLWPKTFREDGRFFGLDDKELNKIRAKYVANGQLPQYYMQYYNDANSAEIARFDKSQFQYYDRKFLIKQGEGWDFKLNKLNVYGAIDFAYSLNGKADYTAILIIGMDSNKYIYILDIDRFKTKNPIEYFNRVKDMHVKWNLKKLRVEVTAAQVVICEYLKDSIRQDGLNLSIDEHRPNRNQGTKAERIVAALDALYQNKSIWHFEGGYNNMLEEELLMDNPPHDDLKDALASAVELAKPPARNILVMENVKRFNAHPRFGGIR